MYVAYTFTFKLVSAITITRLFLSDFMDLLSHQFSLCLVSSFIKEFYYSLVSLLEKKVFSSILASLGT